MRRLPLLCLALLSSTALSAQTPYRTPPQVIVDILDAPPLPSATISPDRQWLLLLEQRSMPTIAELAAPMLRLAGTGSIRVPRVRSSRAASRDSS